MKPGRQINADLKDAYLIQEETVDFWGPDDVEGTSHVTSTEKKRFSLGRVVALFLVKEDESDREFAEKCEDVYGLEFPEGVDFLWCGEFATPTAETHVMALVSRRYQGERYERLEFHPVNFLTSGIQKNNGFDKWRVKEITRETFITWGDE